MNKVSEELVERLVWSSYGPLVEIRGGVREGGELRRFEFLAAK